MCQEGLKQIKHQGPKQENTLNFAKNFGKRIFEESIVACIWAESHTSNTSLRDFKVWDRWVHNYLNNWAIQTLFVIIPYRLIRDDVVAQYIAELKKVGPSLINDSLERAAAVRRAIIPARKGMFLKDIFELADILLLDTARGLYRKATDGCSKLPAKLPNKPIRLRYVSKREVMPRTAFRYAIEKMPADLRAEAMKK
jgi:3-methyladenine DNA glycosylase AlkD